MDEQKQENFAQVPAENAAVPARKKKDTVSNRSFIIALTIVIILGIVLNVFIGSVRVKETSMLPNFVENDHLLINKMAYKLGEPQRGDVIIFRKTVFGTSENLIKRVIGLPGDTITIKNDKVYINGKKQDQSYTKDGITTGAVNNFKVPEGQLYVMGDNRVVSLDSRSQDIGTVTISKVKGKVIFRLTPFSKFGTIPHYGGDE